MKLLVTTFAVACFTTACTGSTSGTVQPDVVTMPGEGGAFGGMSFSLVGPTAPGSVSLTDAHYLSEDDSVVPQNSGSGSMSITVGGQAFVSSDLAAVWTPIFDEDGSSYIGVGGIAVRATPSGERMEQVIVIVPDSDVVSGATVELDGDSRFVLFASGDPAGEPDVWAAALTGTVTFGDVGTNPGELITATVAGDFGPIEVFEDGGDGYDPEPSVSVPLPSGTYTLTVASRRVYCDGTLTGQEEAFAAIDAAALGITEGTVTVTSSPASISGPVLSAAVFTTSAPLDDYGQSIWGYAVTRNDAGYPLDTTREGVWIALDSRTASSDTIEGFIGSDFQDGDGYCGIGYDIVLVQ